MSAETHVIHMAGPGGLFDSSALCGTSYETHVLRQSDAPELVTCQVCLDLMGGAT